MVKLDNQTIQIAILALVALALAAQAIIFFALFLVLRKSMQSLTEKIDDTRSSIMPIVDQTRELLASVSPKIVDTTADIAALTKSLRAQTGDVQQAATEIVERVRNQASRIDTLLSSTLDAVDRATGFMSETMSRPMRQLSALVASVKAAVESLRSFEPAPRAHQDQESSDSDLFV